MRALLFLLVLAGCARGVTPSETQLIDEIMGESIALQEVRLLEAGVIGMITRTYPVRPQVTCQARINGPPTGPTFKSRTAGAVAWTHVLTNPDWTLPDYLPGYPERINLVAAMFFAHEMTHVWQWQNRALTGYAPWRGAAEHVGGADPYLFDPEQDITFLEMGYEQQAALVEEFICCRTLAPEAARTERLYGVLSQVMPVQHPSQTPRPSDVTGVAANADLAGVCD